MVGIEIIRNSIMTSPPLAEFFMEGENLSEEKVRNFPESKYFEILDDLVQRRNIVSHGSDTHDLLSQDILGNYSKYILSLMQAIHCIVIDRYYELMVNRRIAHKLGTPIKVIDNRIVCINSSNLHIKIGQMLIEKMGKTLVLGELLILCK